MRHIHKSETVQVTGAGAAAVVSLPTQNEPFEGLTFWIRLQPKDTVGQNIDLTPQIDGVDIAAKKLTAVATGLPQAITIDGILPPGVPISLKVENKAVSGRVTVKVDIAARSYGPATS